MVFTALFLLLVRPVVEVLCVDMNETVLIF